MANTDKDRTDWNAVDTLNDDDIATAVGNDPDAAPLEARGLTLVKMGRPKKNNPKQATTIRLPVDVLVYFKTDGKGWQTRISDVLSKYVAEHSIMKQEKSGQ